MAISPRRRGSGGVLGVGPFKVDCPWEEEGQEADRGRGRSHGEDPARLLAMVPTQDLHKASLAHSGLIFFPPFLTRTSQHLLCLLSRKEIGLHLPRKHLGS